MTIPYDQIDFNDAQPQPIARNSAFAEHAEQLIAAGHSPLPIIPGAKRPDVRGWQQGAAEQMHGEFLAGFIRQNRHGLGVACGFNDLIAVDIDTEDPAIMAAVRGVLAESTVAKVGKKGRTDFYRASGDVKNRKFKNGMNAPFVEILGKGSQTVIPPTVHPDTREPYRWLTELALWDVRPAELPEITPELMERLEAALAPWLDKKERKSEKAEQSPSPAPANVVPFAPSGNRMASYARSTVAGCCKDLAATVQGGRNKALFDAACRCGRFVHHGIISRDELAAGLIGACQANGLFAEDGAASVDATIESGLDKAAGDALPELEDRPQAAGSAPAEAQALATFEQIEAACRMLGKESGVAEFSRIIGGIVRGRLEPLQEDHLLSIIKRNSSMSIASLREQLKLLKRRFGADADEGAVQAKPAWHAQLKRDLLGSPERNERNIMIPLMNDPAFAGAIAFDEFRQETMVTKPLPWDAGHEVPRAWSETDDINCAIWLQQRDVNVSPSLVSRSVHAVARDATMHSVRDYLSALVWDGRERLERWPVTYLGADDTRLNCAFGSLWCLSAVARIFDPGCKADHMLILEGPQGGRKSSALKLMAGAQWFTDELADVGSKDAAQQVAGVWIIELAELDAIGRADVRRIKAFLSRTSDRYRPAYGRYVVNVPRQCVFAGSVNPDTYLTDDTGNRRFWPIRCGVIDIEALSRDRDQLWAEAVARYRAGAVWWMTDGALVEHAKTEQDDRYQGDAWDEKIDRWLKFDPSVQTAFPNAPPLPRLTPLTDVSVSEILEKAIGLDVGRWSRGDQMRIAAYLKLNGWQRYRVSVGERNWRYRLVS